LWAESGLGWATNQCRVHTPTRLSLLPTPPAHGECGFGQRQESENPLQLFAVASSVGDMKTNTIQMNVVDNRLHKTDRSHRGLWGKALLPALLGCAAIGMATSVSSAPVQWELANGGNGHYYEAILVGTNITWEAAVSAAQLRGGYLATITSAAENQFVKGLFATDSAFFHRHACCPNVTSGPWISAYASSYTARDWAWITGEPYSFSAWGPGEPANNGDRISYARFYTNLDPKWNDIPSGHSASPQSYIVEHVTLPEPPALHIQQTTTNTVVVSWPAPASAGYVLQSCTNLAAGNWSTVTEPVSDDGTNRWVVLPPTAECQVFRLAW